MLSKPLKASRTCQPSNYRLWPNKVRLPQERGTIHWQICQPGRSTLRGTLSCSSCSLRNVKEIGRCWYLRFSVLQRALTSSRSRSKTRIYPISWSLRACCPNQTRWVVQFQIDYQFKQTMPLQVREQVFFPKMLSACQLVNSSQLMTCRRIHHKPWLSKTALICLFFGRWPHVLPW